MYIDSNMVDIEIDILLIINVDHFIKWKNIFYSKEKNSIRVLMGTLTWFFCLLMRLSPISNSCNLI